MKNSLKSILFYLVLIVGLIIFVSYIFSLGSSEQADYGQILTMLEEEKVTGVSLDKKDVLTLTVIWRSKRPGRSSAGSRMSGRFVAAMTIMPSCVPKPSISTSSWFSVCSLSSCPPPRPAPRCRPTASISSMKIMEAGLLRAVSNKSRTREAPTPTYISTKSEPEIE